MTTYVYSKVSPRNTAVANSADRNTFEVRFSRFQRLLYFVAFRILGREREADAAVRRSRIAALHNLPSFEYEGAFRSWMVRILIDEALLILRQRTHFHFVEDFPGQLAGMTAA